MSDFSFGRVFIDGGFRPAVVKSGYKWSQVVYIDSTHVRVKRVRGEVSTSPLGQNVTLRELARKMMCRTNALGLPMSISKAARSILKEARQWAT